MNDSRPRRIRVIDTHTGGEPTRLIIEGGPDLGTGSLVERRERFRMEHDDLRSAVVNEPRGSDVFVGGLLCEPSDPTCVAGVIFFNNVGYLGMCGHGTIGLVTSLVYLERLGAGQHRIDTPAGVVTAVLHSSREVTVTNVPSYRHLKGVTVDVEGYGRMSGDVAWGGNWFFLVEDHGQELDLDKVDRLKDCALGIRAALERDGVRGDDGHVVDHIELFGPPHHPMAHSRNFVLCPGNAYDRSPCGTGTSAKMACLVADGRLGEGEVWRQESIVGSLLEGSVVLRGDEILPRIKGTAYISADSTLILDPSDPFRVGIRS